MLKQLRYFFTLMLLAVASVGFAGTIVFGDLELENGVQYTDPFDGGDFTVTFAGGGNDGKYYTTGSGIRVYGDGTMTIAAKSGTLTSITVTFSGTYKPESGDVVDTGSYDAETGVWEGSASQVTFTRPSGQGHWRIQKVEATVSGGVQKEAAELSFGENKAFTVEPNADFEAPELDNPNELDVTYSSSDEDIALVDENTGEVVIGDKEGTATITATSEETDDYYAGRASYTITVKAPVQALANIAALTEQTEAGEYAVKLNNAVVTYVNGNYAYIQDESGAVVMYKSGHGLTAGQVLNGTATVTFQLRNSNPQITALSGYNATDGTAPEPTEVAADAWNTPIATVLSQYFKVTGATLTKDGNKYYVQLGDENVQLYGQAGANPVSVASLEPTYTIIGFPTLYNTTKELQIFVQPIPEEEVVVVPTPTFNPAAGAVEAGTTVTIELPEGAEGIEYSFDQQTWNEYTAPIEITEATTIYARAYDQDDNYSEVVSAKYTIKEEVPTQDVVIVEEDKTTFLFNTPGNEWGFPTDYTTEAAEFTANGKTIEVGGPEGYKYNTSDKYLIFGKTDAYITLPAFDFPVGKIEVVGRENASGNTKQNIFVGETAISTETTGAKGTNEYIIPANYQTAGTVYTLKVTNNYNSQVTQIIVYKADGTVVLADPELAYEVETFTATIGEDNEFPVLSNPNELPVTYTSSDENVATIDEAGNITLVAAGETTITATSDETSEFEAGEASYLLVVEGEVTPIEYGKYQLVTDASTLAAGDEILIAYVNVGEEATVAQAIGSEQAANNRPAVDVTYNDDETLTPDATAQIITLEGDAEGWNFNVGNGYLYAASTTKNWLRTEAEADENAKATITIDEIGDATIVFQGENTRNTLRFNPNNGSPIFSCYGSTSTTGSLPRIYRKVAEVEGETVPVTISDAEWATLYYSDKAFEIPEGVTAKIATAIDEKDEIKLEDLNGIIPAGTAVVLNGPQGTYDFKVVNDETVAPANNLLRGFDTSHLTEGGDIYYKLTVKNDIVGFYWGEENGEAFESGAHKAYLAIPAGASNAKFFVLGTAGDLVSEDGGFVDGINEVTASDSKNEYFNLNGTRVNSLRKGIYIVGGKKVVIK